MKGNLSWKINRNEHKTTQKRAQQESAGFEESIVPSDGWWLGCSLLYIYLSVCLFYVHI